MKRPNPNPDMTLKLKRSEGRKTEISCGNISLFMGDKESFLRGDISYPSSEYISTSRATFHALIKISQAALEEMDLLEQEEIKQLEQRLAQLKKVDRQTDTD